MRGARTARWVTLALAMIALAVLLANCNGRQTRAPVPDIPTVNRPNPTATPGAVATVTSESFGLPNAGARPEATPPPQVYRIQSGDTLSSIARRFGCDLKALIEANQIADPNILRVGQKIQLAACQIETGPVNHLLPNSEFVNGPAYVDFDVAAFSAAQGGYLAEYHENVGGEVLSGPEIVSLVAHRYSVGPRLLLAVLEMKSGWVTDPNPTDEALSYPMGYKGGGWQMLYWQLAWAADKLNQGYYDWRGRGTSPIIWRSGTVTHYAPTLNAATAGLQYFLSLNANERKWETWVGEGSNGFTATYRRLFGNPDHYAVEPLIPADSIQPPLALPWPKGELWYYTGGPHGGWEDGSAWAALDFVPQERVLGCRVASSWATASAAGLVIYSQDGVVMIDLDEDGHEETGWVLFYLHVANRDRVSVGTRVKQGDRIGHPSCEGGLAEATHLHIARKYNGEWIAADGPLPFLLSGWQAHSSGEPYEGTLTQAKKVRTACECRDEEYNGLVADR
jgi:LasA protease